MNLLLEFGDWTSILIAIVLGLGLGWLMTRNKNNDFTNIHVITKEEFIKNMRRGQLVDMRKADVFETDKIKGARNFKPSVLNSKYSKLRKDLPVYLYCDNGKKSKRTAKKLIKNEYKAVYVLEGGFVNYKNETH